MSWTASRPTNSPSPSAFRTPSPSSSTWTAGSATSPSVRSWDELPENARNYVEYVERAIGCHIGYVSVGAERDSLIIR